MAKNRPAKKDNNKEKKGKKEKGVGKRMKKEAMIQAIISVFQSSPKEPFNYKQISKIIGVENQVQKLQVVDILYDLSAEDIITEIDRGRYRLNGLGTLAVGTFARRSNGKNSFIPEDGGTPVFIAERNSGHAMDGDKVKVQLFAKRKGAEPEGEVVEILESKERTFVGKLQVAKGFAFLITENKTLANDIFIPKDKLKGGKNGDKAIVRIVEWPDEAKNPLGEVIDILGIAGQNTAEMHAILAEFGLPYKYPSSVEKAADKIPEAISPEEIENREDFRGITTFTIDPKAGHGETYIAYIRILVESGEDAVTEEEFLIIFADLMGGYEDVVPADHGKCLGERDQFLLHRGAFGCVEDEMDVIVGSILRGAFRREEGAYIYVPAVVGKCRGGKFSCLFIVIIFKLWHEKPRTAAIQFFEEAAQFQCFFSSSFVFSVCHISDLLFPPIR